MAQVSEPKDGLGPRAEAIPGSPLSSEVTSRNIFALILNRFRDNFGRYFAAHAKQIKKGESKKRSATTQVGIDQHTVARLGEVLWTRCSSVVRSSISNWKSN